LVLPAVPSGLDAAGEVVDELGELVTAFSAPSSPRPATVGVRTVKKSSNPKETGWKEWLGDVFTYRDDLPAIADKMARALDDGWTIRVRVLSGSVGSDEEHSVLVIGHYDAKTFFFFDPDVGAATFTPPATTGCTSTGRPTSWPRRATATT
jgi:hypothetical protein